ncbi:MAG TPA: DUF6265 family protein [Candidatus Angelobacter sp.]
MKRLHNPGSLLALVLLLLAPVLPAQKSGNKSKIAELTWLTGHWTADLPEGHVDQYWTTQGPEGYMGMSRLANSEKTLVVEFLTLSETPTGIEMRVRQFDMAMTLAEKDQPVILRLKSLSKDTVVFENPFNNQPKRSTLKRLGPDSFRTRTEVVGADKKTTVIEVILKRAPD